MRASVARSDRIGGYPHRQSATPIAERVHFKILSTTVESAVDMSGVVNSA